MHPRGFSMGLHCTNPGCQLQHCNRAVSFALHALVHAACHTPAPAQLVKVANLTTALPTKLLCAGLTMQMMQLLPESSPSESAPVCPAEAAAAAAAALRGVCFLGDFLVGVRLVGLCAAAAAAVAALVRGPAACRCKIWVPLKLQAASCL